MGILLIVLLLVGGYFLYTRFRGESNGDIFDIKKKTPLDVAKERYANVEISREEYDELKENL